MINTLSVFVICYLWIKLAEIWIGEPHLRTVKTISYCVALILAVVLVLRPIGI